jgi:DNA-binding transcriptional ArsR family regulator
LSKKKILIVSISILKGKNENELPIEEILRQMDAQRAQMAIELERLKNLGEKIQEIESRLREMERIISTGGFKLNTKPVTSKTKEAIKMILQKYGELTPLQLSRLIKLSRTRCNEYLKEMEREGILTSRIESRKKYYKLRQ